MRFSIATVVLSLTAMVVAIPTTESTLFARGGGQTCAQGQTLSCCQSVTSGGDGILGNLLGLNCKFYFVNPLAFTNLQVLFRLAQKYLLTRIIGAEIPIPIVGIVLGGKCNSAPVCCNVNGGSTSVSSLHSSLIFIILHG